MQALLQQLQDAQEASMKHIVEAEVLREEVERLKAAAAATASSGSLRAMSS